MFTCKCVWVGGRVHHIHNLTLSTEAAPTCIIKLATEKITTTKTTKQNKTHKTTRVALVASETVSDCDSAHRKLFNTR